MKQKIAPLLPALLCLTLLGVMFLAAQLLQEPEIIFPEITALAVGAILAPKQVWRVTRGRMLLLICVCAVCGVCIARYLPLPLVVQLLLAYGLALGAAALSRTTFFPLISALVLPVLLHTTTWIYPLSAAAMTALVCLTQWGLERVGLRAPTEFSSVTERPRPAVCAKRVLWVGLLFCAAVGLHLPFVAAPPLLVGFTELSEAESPARKRPVALVLLTALAATLGAGARGILCGILGLSATWAVLCAVGALIAVMCAVKLYFPPAAAIATLPFLLPQSAMLRYAPAVAAGFAVLTAAAMLTFGKHPNAEQTSITNHHKAETAHVGE